MKHIKKLALILLCVLMMTFPVYAEESETVTILFTHDLHSHFLPYIDNDGKEVGGFARLKTVIDLEKEKDPNAILVDAGDFSMGSLFQTAYTSSALELRMLGALGYDATTFGNHEFDYLPEGVSKMLKAAKESNDPLPYIVNGNFNPTVDVLKEAYEDFGVKEYVLVEKGDKVFGIFGLMGYESDDFAPNSGSDLIEPAEAAKAIVEAIQKEALEKYNQEAIVVLVSHSGLSKEGGEDVDLANAVSGIDVIVSGHSHSKLNEPLVINDTHIVACGDNGRYLGVLKLERDGDTYKVKDYRLEAIDSTVKEDPTIKALIDDYKRQVEDDYLSHYGMTFDQVLIDNQIEFESLSKIKGSQKESTLGNLFADAYKWKIEEVIGEEVDFATTAAGVLRETLKLGNITVSDIFNAASLGVGTEGELILIYLTGKDLKTVLEIDASVTPLMSSAQLYPAGMRYSYNQYRMLFNKVDEAKLLRNDGSLQEIEDDKMYKVVAGMYAGQMLGSVKETSFGLISVTPRNEKGEAIRADELVNYVVKDENGNPVKEWYAIASYLLEMDGKMDEQYRQTDGRKLVYTSLNPVDLLKNANIFTYAVIAILILIVLLVSLVIRFIRKRRKKNLK